MARSQDHEHDFAEVFDDPKWLKVCACGFKYEFEKL
jgi:hypothetical protein